MPYKYIYLIIFHFLSIFKGVMEACMWYWEVQDDVFIRMHMCAAVMCTSGQQWLTADGEHVVLDLCGDLDAAPPLSVVSPTQTRHVGHAALMDVHHAIWIQEERKSGSNYSQIYMHRCIFCVHKYCFKYDLKSLKFIF